MIILITGASHTGKTLLAQRMLEEYKYPYLSIDHLKMGLIRSGNTTLTPLDDDALTNYLWPIVREMVKTAIENQQNLIVEGCYIPSDWKKSFDEHYLQSIHLICLAMTDEYIDTHFDEIKNHASVIETRLYNTAFTPESLKADNHHYIDAFTRNGEQVTLIDTDYIQTIRTVVETMNFQPNITLAPLQPDDREQFILDNQWAFKYGAQQEMTEQREQSQTCLSFAESRRNSSEAQFGLRDTRTEEGEEVISRTTIENSINRENAESYRIFLNGEKVGGVVLRIDREKAFGELELLFVNPEVHSKGIGQAAWKAVEAIHPEIKVWETITPYFEKRNIHFYVNRCGFHIVEFWNKYQHGPAIPEEEAGNWSEDDEMFVFRKVIE